jgi:hypothetical protein
MAKTALFSISMGTFVTMSLLGRNAFAQGTDAQQSGGTQTGGQASGQVSVGANGATTQTTTQTGTPTPAQAKAADTKAVTRKPEEVNADHELFFKHFAIGFMGATTTPIANAASRGGGAISREQVPTVTVGGRYWFAENMGVDVGLGLSWIGGSTTTVNGPVSTTVDDATTFGGRLHGGLPISFANARHYSFLVIPELNIGYTTRTIAGVGPNTPDTTQTGFNFDLGARAGAEVYFGFIGVPELSLQATLGLGFSYDRVKASTDNNSSSVGSSGIATTLQQPPWAIFTNAISAFYYFP